MNARLVLLSLFIAVVGCGESKQTQPAPYGRFEGEVVATWLPDGRTMKLTKDFAYVDPQQKRWQAPAGVVVDGASIPQPFWSLIGGPFEGQYRSASVVHDVACVEMKEPWEAVHLMFYEACRCGGVEEAKAKLMYWAVYQFGPHWRPVSEVREKNGKRETVTRMVRMAPAPHPSEETVRKAKEYFANNNPSLEEIKTLKLPD